MKVISVIEDEEIIKKILKHLGLWEIKARPPPRANASPIDTPFDYSAPLCATRLPCVVFDHSTIPSLTFAYTALVIGLCQGFSDPALLG